MTTPQKYMFTVKNEYVDVIMSIFHEEIRRTMKLDDETLFLVTCLEETISKLSHDYNITLYDGSMPLKMIK